MVSLKLDRQLSRRRKAILSRYISDMHLAISEVSRVLVPGGKAIYVIGENTIEGAYIQNAKIIKKLAGLVGLEFEGQNKRKLPPNRRYLPPPIRSVGIDKVAMNTRIRREVVLHFIKPRSRKPI
jgi:hypothetical protein